jgi:hypothetical protein
MALSSNEHDTIPQNLGLEDQHMPASIVSGRYGSALVYCLIGIAVLFAVADGMVASWQDQDVLNAFVFASIALILIWFGAGYAQQLERLLRKGYALKLDRYGLHHFNLPSIPWSDLGSAVIEVEELNDRKITYMCLGLTGHTQMLIAGSEWWKAVAGREIKLHESRRAIMLPCDQIDEEPNRLADRINRMIREHQGRKA